MLADRRNAGAMQQREVANLNGSSNIGALEPMKSCANYQTLRCNCVKLFVAEFMWYGQDSAELRNQ